jgi:hypothetical protein
MNRALASWLAVPIVACAGSVAVTPAAGDAGAGGFAAGGGGAGGSAGGGGATGGGGAGGGVVVVPCACPDPTLAWTTVGGYVFSRDTVTIDGCAALTLTRDMLMGGDAGEPDRVCHHGVAPCDAQDPIGVDALAQAFGQPDVRAALQKAAQTGTEPLYGRDNRPTDGVLFRVTSGAASFLVGDPCWQGEPCAPITPGIAAMRDTLTQLELAVAQSAECAAILAGKP